jgi:hypothetical protein
LILSSEGRKMKTGIILGFQSVNTLLRWLSGYHSYWYKTEEIRDDRSAEIFYYSEKARN